MHEAVRAEVGERVLAADEDLALVVVGPGWSGRSATLSDVAELCARRDRVVVRVDAQQVRSGGVLPTVADGAALLVDDAHLLDEITLDAVTELVADRRATDTWVVVTHALGVLPPALARLRAHLDTVVELGPVTIDEVARTIPLPELAGPLHTWTGGWAGLLAASGGDDGATTVPPTIAATIETRLALLDADARAVVASLAFGASAADGSLERLSGLNNPSAALASGAAVGVVHGDELVPVVAAAVRAVTDATTRRTLFERLVGADTSTAVLRRAAGWAEELGERSAVAGELFRRCGQVSDDPTEAVHWLTLASACGAADAALDLARAALRAGDPSGALGFLTRSDDDERLELMGHAFAHLGRRREARRWYERAGSPYVDLVNEGEPSTESWRVDPVIEPHAVGLARWRSGDARGGIEALAEAMRQAEQLEPGRLRPDTPHAAFCRAVAALLDIGRAEDSLQRASEIRVGGLAHRSRHDCLAGWVALRAGRYAEACDIIDGIDRSALTPRDALVHLAAHVGLGVRTNRFDDLNDEIVAGVRLLGDLDLDALDLPVLVELAVAAGRAHDAALADRLLASVDALVDAHGAPPLHRFQAAWGRLQAAMAGPATPEARSAAVAMQAIEVPDDRLRPLVVAARVYAEACDGEVDAEQVTTAAAALEQLGLVHEAARLLGTAALRSGTENDTRGLLKASRNLRGSRRRVAGAGADVGVLSERELEVAREVAGGSTYKEIGATLFISAKTVEHHVAKIRQKLGAANRAEMLTLLRNYLDDGTLRASE